MYPIIDAGSKREKQFYVDTNSHMKEQAIYPPYLRKNKPLKKKPTENLTHGNRVQKRAKTFKEKRENSVSGIPSAYSNMSSRHHLGPSFKTGSSQTSSLKTLHKERLQEYDNIEENYKEDLHSSSSADTIPIKDKILLPNKNKLKEFVDAHTTHSDPNKVPMSSQYPIISQSAVYRLRQNENKEKARENASSLSSSTSFKNLNIMGVNNTIADSKRKKFNENYFSEGTIDSEIVSSDGNTAINHINLQKNFFSNDRSVFSNETKPRRQKTYKSSRRNIEIDQFPEMQMWPKGELSSPDTPLNSKVTKYLEKVQKGLNTMDRLTLWRSLPNYTKYKEYYRKKKYCNFKRSEYYLEIKNDVRRTYLHCSLNEETELQNSLVNILSIYAMRNPKIGYVQGMNFLAGTLFLQCGFDTKLLTSKAKTEEETFSMLTIILEDYRLGDLYLDGFLKLRKFMEIIEKGVRQYLPNIRKHFGKDG